MKDHSSTIDRGLWWADATFYAACSSSIALLVLTNTLSHAEKWVGPTILDRVPLIAALHHSAYRSVYFVTVSFIINAPFHVLSGLAGAVVFLIAQRPRSFAYSTLIMGPQITPFVYSVVVDNPRPTSLWVTTELAWIVIALGVFHGLSLAASRAAVVTLGQEVQPTARVLRLIGILLATGPALYLVLEAHSFLYSGFKPSMRVLVPLAALALLLCLTIRYGSRPAVMAAITAGFLVLMFGV